MSNKYTKHIEPILRFPEFRNTESWEITLLSKIAQVIAGQSPAGINYNDNEKGLPFYQGKTNFGDIYLLTPSTWTTEITKTANPGDILMSVRAPVGALNISPDKICIGRGLAAIQTKRNRWFLYYFLSSIQKFIVGNDGAIFDSINKEQIEKIHILIPHSIEEQQKIADCLSSNDELITAESKKLDALKVYKKGLIQQLFPTKDESLPKLRFPYFHHDGNWKIKLLGNLIKYKNGIAHEQHISDIGKYIVVNSKFISTEGVVRKFTNDGFCIAKKGNILMVLSDVPNGKAIAKCFLVDRDELYTVNQRICIIDPEKNISEFIYYTIDRNPFYLNFDDGIKQTNLRKDDVLACPIFVPPSEKEQQKIAEVIASVDNLIISQSKKLDVLKNHKKGLMQQLFPNISEL